MTFKKSMMSIAAAAVITTGFTGCNGGDEAGATTATGSDHYKTPKGTVTGLVQDTNGNPLSGVKVYIADKEATTNAGGLYTFTDVPVSTTAGMDAPNASQLISVTIAAPTIDGVEYLGATVTVTPSAQIDDSQDSTGGTVVSATETFIEGYLAQAGTAVLPSLDATVSGKLELQASEAAVANQVINLDFKNVNTTFGANVAQPQNGVATSYATKNYTATTDANGMFTISGVPADSDLTYVVGNYTVVGEEVVQGIATTGALLTDATAVTTNNEVAVVNVGDIQIKPVVNEDNAAPFIKSASNVFTTIDAGVDLNTTIGANFPNDVDRAMLHSSVTNTLTFNFSEPLMAIDNPTSAIKVYNNTKKAYDAAATATMSGSTITVTLGQNIGTDSIDVFFMREMLKDTAGNLAFVDYDNNTTTDNDNVPNCQLGECISDSNPYIFCTAESQAIVAQIQGYKQLNLNAEAPTNVVQMQLDTDTNRTAGSVLSAIETYSNAFNDVNVSKTISQLNNVSEDRDNDPDNVANRLQKLAVALGETTVTKVDTDTARIQFVAGTAAKYRITVPTGATCNAGNLNVTVKSPTCNVTETEQNGATATESWEIVASAGTTVDVVVEGVQHKDDIIITPLDDLCKAGTSATIEVVDNVAPTTVLQNSYMDSACTTSDTIAWNTFGDGGELSNGTSDGTAIGLPILSLTPALFDNLDDAGNNILDANQYVTADEDLSAELITKNTSYDHDSNTNTANTTIDKVKNSANLYDATAYAVFASNMARTVGIAMSEDVQNIPTTAAYNGTTAITDFTVLNNVTRTDSDADTNATNNDAEGGVQTTTESDLVTFKTTDVMAMANSITNSAFPTIDLTGIQDLAGNVASNAKVAVYDRMPPMVKRAYKLNGIVTIEFNEDIIVNTNSNIVVDGVTHNYVANTWNVNGNVLTIGTLTSPSGITLNSDANTTYAEAAYNDITGISGTEKYPHATLGINLIGDKNGNTWEAWNSATNCVGDTNNEAHVDMPEPMFAMVNVKTAFEITTNNTNYVFPNNYEAGVSSKTQTLVWNFTHTLDTEATFGTSEDTVDPTSAQILDNLEYYETAGNTATKLDGNLTNFGISNVSADLSSNRQTLTLTFTQNKDGLTTPTIKLDDVIRYVNAGTNNKVQSDEDDNAQNATQQGYDQGN